MTECAADPSALGAFWVLVGFALLIMAFLVGFGLFNFLSERGMRRK